MDSLLNEPLWHRELFGAIKRLDLAFYIAWSDTRTRYRRSVLGPFWLVLGTAIGVVGLSYVWSTIFQIDRATFVPALTVSLIVWIFLSATITEATSVFYANREILLNIPTSSLLISLLLLLRQLVNFGHNFVVVVAVLVIYPQHVTASSLLAIPGFLLVCLNLIWIIQLLGYFGARYRDLSPLVAALMPLLFFITPVLFRPHQLGSSAHIAEWNPLSWFLSLIRDPLMGEVPPPGIWIAALLMACVGCWAAAVLTIRKRDRLAYWVH